MGVQLQLSSITFRDGTEIALGPGSVLLVVGPNNSGKTSALREIRSCLAGKDGHHVVERITVAKAGTASEIKEWLDEHVALTDTDYGDRHYRWLGEYCNVRNIEREWNTEHAGDLATILTTMLDVENRLSAAGPVDAIDFVTDAPTHPLHVMYQDDRIEQALAQHVRAAFGSGIVVNRVAAKRIYMHFGMAPTMGSGEARISRGYARELAQLPLLHRQGHGIRSFTGCLLHVMASPSFVQFIDEPEVFLHPPHARLLAELLVRERSASRQLIVATHSADIMRGAIDAGSANVQVIRLARDADKQTISKLPARELVRVWSDPILRFSNVMDGLFHDIVVVTEGDSDCRFYASVLGTLQPQGAGWRRDVMFTSSGGKQRMAVIVTALRSLGVPTKVIADFDVLREAPILRPIVESLGGTWADIEAPWKRFVQLMNAKTAPLNRHQVRAKILEILDGEATESLSSRADEGIRLALKASSVWQSAKLAGISAVPSGAEWENLKALLHQLQVYGLHVVECGEIERFGPSIPGHGPSWVIKALQKDIAHDPEFVHARQFVAGMFGITVDTPFETPSDAPVLACDAVRARGGAAPNSGTRSHTDAADGPNYSEQAKGIWQRILECFRG